MDESIKNLSLWIEKKHASEILEKEETSFPEEFFQASFEVDQLVEISNHLQEVCSQFLQSSEHAST